MKKKGHTNRSKAFSDLVRQELVKNEWSEGGEIAGAITLIYDHHRRELVNKLTDIQHDFSSITISTQHIHLDHDNCLEIIAAKGAVADVQKFANAIKAVNGVKHMALGMSSTGKEI